MDSEEDPLLKSKSRRHSHLNNAGWFDLAFVMASEVIGTGVLGFGKVTATLGMALGAVVICLGLLACMFSALLQTQVKVLFPEATSMAEAAYHTVGVAVSDSEIVRKGIREFVALCVYGFAFLAQGGYVLVLSKSLGGVFFEAHKCLPWWAVIGMVTVFPVLQFRHFSDMNGLCFFNLLTIVGAALICLVTIAKVEGEHADIVAVNTDSNFSEMAGTIGVVLYAYCGNWFYFDLMSEMEKPQDFMKTFRINAPFQLSVYLIVGLVCYSYKGTDTAGYMLDDLPFGNSFRLASLLLYLHVMVSTAIKSTATSRYIQSTIGMRFLQNRFGWMGITLVLLIASGCIALAVPFFSSLIGLIGSLLMAPICFMFPISIFLAAKWLKGESMHVPRWYWPVMVILYGVAVLITVVGTIENVNSIRSSWSTFGSPFSCHCESMWKTCQCSAARIPRCAKRRRRRKGGLFG